MSDTQSVISNASAPDAETLMEMLSVTEPVVEKPKRKLNSKKVIKLAQPVTETVVAPLVVESSPEPEPEISPDMEMEKCWDYINSVSSGLFDFVAQYKAMKEAKNKPKNDNSPDLVDGIHMRMVNGVKTKCKYIFPYAADGGKSIVKDMKDGQKCIGVSTTQKNNTKDSCKVADYELIWVNSKMVRDTKSNKVYPQKDGKIAIVNEEDMTSFNVRLMVVA